MDVLQDIISNRKLHILQGKIAKRDYFIRFQIWKSLNLKSRMDEKSTLFFGVFRVPTHLPTGCQRFFFLPKHYLGSIFYLGIYRNRQNFLEDTFFVWREDIFFQIPPKSADANISNHFFLNSRQLIYQSTIFRMSFDLRRLVLVLLISKNTSFFFVF